MHATAKQHLLPRWRLHATIARLEPLPHSLRAAHATQPNRNPSSPQVLIHVLAAYQVYSQPVFYLVSSQARERW